MKNWLWDGVMNGINRMDCYKGTKPCKMLTVGYIIAHINCERNKIFILLRSMGLGMDVAFRMTIRHVDLSPTLGLPFF